MKQTNERVGRHQVAALPYKQVVDGSVEILLLSARNKHRLIIPKGWCSGPKGWKAAKKEAFEEAGLIGKIDHHPIGQFDYWKRAGEHFELMTVDVYPLKVERQLKKWPEKDQRAMQWLSAADAALLIDEPRLVTLIREFCRVPEDVLMAPDRRPKRHATG